MTKHREAEGEVATVKKEEVNTYAGQRPALFSYNTVVRKEELPLLQLAASALSEGGRGEFEVNKAIDQRLSSTGKPPINEEFVVITIKAKDAKLLFSTKYHLLKVNKSQ